MLYIGEVHTGLIQHGTTLSENQCVSALSVQEGEVVLRARRPTTRAISPTNFCGVDCLLPSGSRRSVRCAGTVGYHASITGGRVLQGTSHASLIAARDSRRLSWSHYLGSPGTIEAIGKVDWPDVVRGFIHGQGGAETLNVGGVSSRAMDRVQRSDELDRHPPFRAQRTILRWSITDTAGEPTTAFTIGSGPLRTVEIQLAETDLRDGIALCEDLALHDWLLTTLAELLEVTRTSSRPAVEKMARLRPPVEHLLHLWMPGARVPAGVQPIWDMLEQRPGFTRQWDASVHWIRDQIAVSTMTLMQAMLPHIAIAQQRDQSLMNR